MRTAIHLWALGFVLSLAGGSAAGALPGPLPTPGTVIDHTNVRRYTWLLPEYALRWVRDGAWFGERGRQTIEVAPTRPAPLPAAYRNATKRHHASVRMEGKGIVHGWVAGLPFPDPKPPELGAKIMWNQYYRWRGDDTVIDTYRTVQTDRRGNRRETAGIFQILTLAGRTDRGGPSRLPGDRRGLRTASKLIFTDPPDSRWQTTMFYRYLDPTRDDDVYLYLPSTRRVLRVQGGRRCSPVRGSDFTPDDFFGFDGRVQEHRWRVVDAGPALAVMHQQSIPTRLDALGAWPEGELWELREVWVVEGVPKDEDYCYARRRLWVDRETYEVLHADVWDPYGVYWKGFFSGYAHHKLDTGDSGPVWAGTAAYDFQSGHITFVTVGEPELGFGYRIDGSDLGLTDFTPNALLRAGR